MWLKNSKRLIVGLALPEEYEAEGLGPRLPGTMYKGLNKYFVVERGGVGAEGPCRMGGAGLSECLVSGTFDDLQTTLPWANLPQEEKCRCDGQVESCVRT